NEGKIRWVRQLPSYQNEKKKKDPITWAGPVLGSDRLIVLSSTGDAFAISPYTGEPLGREEMSAGGYTAPVIADNSLYVLTADADVALLVIDAREGITEADRHFADWLRRIGKPVVVLANKAEGRAAPSGIGEAYRLGIGDPVPISAEHGEGLAELYERLVPFS